jgi:hypothetical protein
MAGMKSSLSADSLADLTDRLRVANEEFTGHYPGETGRRQPVHTVYGGAHLFKSDSASRLGSLARRSLDQFAPDFLTFAMAIDLPGSEELPGMFDDATELVPLLKNDPDRARKEKKAAWLAHTIYNRVSEKLQREPVEDFRIDFEDGYGNRPDDEEDGHAVSAATETAEGSKQQRKSAGKFCGHAAKDHDSGTGVGACGTAQSTREADRTCRQQFEV